MSGVFKPGEQKIRPGKYINIKNSGGARATSTTRGIAAVLFQADWGPLGLYPSIGNTITADQVDSIYLGGNVDDLKEVFNGGAAKALPYRLGTGGSKASKTLVDTTEGEPVNVVTLEALYEGNISIKTTLRNSLTDASKKELLVYQGTTLKETITFAKGGGDEPAALVAAVTAFGSKWITATKIADGNGTLADFSAQSLAGGANPTVTAESYTTAMEKIEAKTWNGMCVDSIDTAVHAAVATFIRRVFNAGKRAIAVIGEPTSVLLATRQANAKAFNDFLITYVANGYVRNDGTEIEGHRAAAWVLGKRVSAGYRESLTGYIVPNAVDLKGDMTDGEIQAGILAGCYIFSKNAKDQVQIEYDINTLNTIADPDELDEGWKKNRRVQTRFELIERILAKWSTYKIDNDANGHNTHIANGQGEINVMIREGGLLDGSIMLDPELTPSGDSAWFLVTVLDLDNCEKQYITFGFQY